MIFSLFYLGRKPPHRPRTSTNERKRSLAPRGTLLFVRLYVRRCSRARFLPSPVPPCERQAAAPARFSDAIPCLRIPRGVGRLLLHLPFPSLLPSVPVPSTSSQNASTRPFLNRFIPFVFLRLVFCFLCLTLQWRSPSVAGGKQKSFAPLPTSRCGAFGDLFAGTVF